MAPLTISSDGISGESIPWLYFSMIPIELFDRSMEEDQKAEHRSRQQRWASTCSEFDAGQTSLLSEVCTTEGAKG